MEVVVFDGLELERLDRVKKWVEAVSRSVSSCAALSFGAQTQLSQTQEAQ